MSLEKKKRTEDRDRQQKKKLRSGGTEQRTLWDN